MTFELIMSVENNTEEIQKSTENKVVEEPLTIEEMVETIVIKERLPRHMFFQVLVTLSLVFGPFFLMLDLFGVNFSWLPYDATIIFSSISGLFLFSSIISAKGYS